MTPALLLTLAASTALVPALARAGETPCWLDAGAVVVPAVVAGIAGDFILDTATPQTQLHNTSAQAAGFGEPTVTGTVRLAGVILGERTATVVDLDVRARNFPTPVAGVIGADALQDVVLDVSFEPCRVALYAPGRAPALPQAHWTDMRLIDGVPQVSAAVSDGPRATPGSLVLATALDAPLRLNEAVAQTPGARAPETLFAEGSTRARLRALSLAGALVENVPAGLLKTEAAPAGALGVLGPDALRAFTLRFDFPARRFALRRNEKGPPAAADGP